MAELSFAFQYFSFDGETYGAGSPFEDVVVTSDEDARLSIGEEVVIGEATYTYAGLFGGGIVLEQDGFTLILTDLELEPGSFAPDGDAFVFCFTAGAMVETLAGPRPVETLDVGDLVLTADDGPQPVRWLGCTRMPAQALWRTPALRPVRIGAGALGNRAELLVSPHHRIRIAGWRARALFGEAEVLVAAQDLVNGRTIRRAAPAAVEYWHILFDRHQLVWAEGCLSESLHPGQALGDPGFARAHGELLALFPEIAAMREAAPVRRSLDRAEARLL